MVGLSSYSEKEIDSIFGSLADSTRRDILGRVLYRDLDLSEIAESYDVSLRVVKKTFKSTSTG